MRPGSYLLICPPLRCDLRGAVGASGTIILQRIEIHVKPDDTPGAMLQARDAVERRSWSHPQEPTGEAWRADVLCGPAGRLFARRPDRHAWCGPSDPQFARPPRCTGLSEARLSLGSLRRSLRRADRGHTI